MRRAWTWKRTDIAVMILAPALAVVLSVLFDVNYFASTILFFGVPAAYLSFRTPHVVAKTELFSLLMAFPLTLLVDSFAITNGAWVILRPAFSARFIGIIPIDDFIWGFLLIYLVVVFYEHFLHHGKDELVDKRMKYVAWPLLVAGSLFAAHYLTTGTVPNVPYFYLWSGIGVSLLPVLVSLAAFPQLFKKYVVLASYFFVLFMLFELTALSLHQWAFPGTNFIAWVSIFGLRFPVEEFVFWMLLGACAMVSYYEFFDDSIRGNPLH